ncbi:MAG: shikimate dehydrogenase [Flavobacteriales bacterium]|nr:shikimate dehydrogenase [Flavobacteriales bacterium]
MTGVSKYGLIGRNLEYSFSPTFFNSAFEQAGMACIYDLIDVASLEELDDTLLKGYAGLNVTIPYKESILQRMDELSPEAEAIGAVNCIQMIEDRLVGHNTDIIGFRDSLRPILKSTHHKALILGTGGASKAIAYVLQNMGIEFLKVSRNPEKGDVTYKDLNDKALRYFPLIINTTPSGTFPNVEDAPPIPFEHLGPWNLVYDLIYNPEETLLLSKAKECGALTINGQRMLEGQAIASWKIWTGTDWIGSGEPSV